MKIVFVFVLFLGLVFVGCKSNEKKVDKQQFMDHLKADDNVFEIKETCVVFIYPDSNAVKSGIEKIKKQYGEEGMAEAGSDEGYYRGQAKDFFQSKGIKIIETDKKTILFVNEKGEKTKVENTLEGIASMVYLFDVKKQPLKIESIATIPDGKDFDSYFSNGK